MLSSDFRIRKWHDACEEKSNCSVTCDHDVLGDCEIYYFDKWKDSFVWLGSDKPGSADILYWHSSSKLVSFLELKNRPVNNALKQLNKKIQGSLSLLHDKLNFDLCKVVGFYLSVSLDKNQRSQLRFRLRGYFQRVNMLGEGGCIKIIVNGTNYLLKYALDTCSADLHKKIIDDASNSTAGVGLE